MTLSKEEQIRYSRHLNLPDFGMETQERLKGSSVLVVGTGGLGAPLLQYLVAAGVGRIGVVDFDRVDTSNLQRQVLFGTSDIGKDKVEVAIERLSDQNPHVQFEPHVVRLTSENALEIVESYDVVADGTDNFPTRYLVNDACVLSGKPNVYASIFQFEGQVSVFNYENGPNYRDLFPTPPPPGMVPSCAEGGVLGVLPGIVGALQGLEVIKVLTGIGDVLSGKLLLFDALECSMRTMNVRKDPDNPLTGEQPTIRELIDYEEFCNVKSSFDSVPEIDLEEYIELNEREDVFLIDVREPYEYEAGNMGGVLIPLSSIVAEKDKIPQDGKVIIHCKSGIRSLEAVKKLQDHGFKNACSLKGGIEEWAKKFKPELTVL